MSRNPRMEPRPGDVLRTDGVRREVRSVEQVGKFRYVIFDQKSDSIFTTRDEIRYSITRWREWARKAEVG